MALAKTPVARKREIDPSEKRLILDVVKKWAAQHPRPDKAVMVGFAGRFTPRQMADAMENNSAPGELLYRIVVNGVGRYGSLLAVLEGFMKPGAVLGKYTPDYFALVARMVSTRIMHPLSIFEPGYIRRMPLPPRRTGEPAI